MGGGREPRAHSHRLEKKKMTFLFLEAAILKLVLEVPNPSTLPSRDTLGYRDLGTSGTQRPRLSCPQSHPLETRA